MHFDLIDVYRPRPSRIHNLDARVKLVTAVLLILTAVLLPDRAWLSFGMLLMFLLLTARLARLGWAYAVRRSYVALPFVLAALPLIFITPGPAVWTLPVTGWQLTSTGIARVAAILTRTWLAVQAGVLLSATTAAADLLWGLQALGMPRLLVGVTGAMLRYIFVMADEVLRMLRARAARSPDLPGRHKPGIVWRGRVAGMMAGSFFLRSLERSERVYAAMASRGYRGEAQLLEPPEMCGRDWAALLGLAGVLAAAGLVSRIE